MNVHTQTFWPDRCEGQGGDREVESGVGGAAQEGERGRVSSPARGERKSCTRIRSRRQIAPGNGDAEGMHPICLVIVYMYVCMYVAYGDPYDSNKQMYYCIISHASIYMVSYFRLLWQQLRLRFGQFRRTEIGYRYITYIHTYVHTHVCEITSFDVVLCFNFLTWMYVL